MGCSLWSVMCFLLFLLLAEAIILSGLLHKSHCFHPNALIYRSINFRAFSHLQCLVHLCFVFCGKGLYGLASSCEINFSSSPTVQNTTPPFCIYCCCFCHRHIRPISRLITLYLVTHFVLLGVHLDFFFV